MICECLRELASQVHVLVQLLIAHPVYHLLLHAIHCVQLSAAHSHVEPAADWFVISAHIGNNFAHLVSMVILVELLPAVKPCTVLQLLLYQQA
jgi:hypothetical protein